MKGIKFSDLKINTHKMSQYLYKYDNLCSVALRGVVTYDVTEWNRDENGEGRRNPVQSDCVTYLRFNLRELLETFLCILHKKNYASPKGTVPKFQATIGMPTVYVIVNLYLDGSKE